MCKRRDASSTIALRSINFFLHQLDYSQRERKSAVPPLAHYITKYKKDLKKKKVSFVALSIDTKNLKFNRDEANER